MSKLLLYIGEGQRFDLTQTISAIASIEGVSNLRTGSFVGAIFECEYDNHGVRTTVRISNDKETVVIDGLGDGSLQFAIELQRRYETPLHAIDMNYSFDILLKNLNTVFEFRHAISD